MTNCKIRQVQRANAHKLKQHQFARPTQPISGRWQSHREMDRRKRQIERGQLREANGLVR